MNNRSSFGASNAGRAKFLSNSAVLKNGSPNTLCGLDAGIDVLSNSATAHADSANEVSFGIVYWLSTAKDYEST